jgi:hypothetical protein
LLPAAESLLLLLHAASAVVRVRASIAPSPLRVRIDITDRSFRPALGNAD